MALVFLGLAGLLLLASRERWGRPIERAIRSALRRITRREDLAWLTPGLLVVVVGGLYALIIGFDVARGLYACAPGGGPNDTYAFVLSGHALLTGGNPFTLSVCGSAVVVPYGLAGLVGNALGSLGGEPGVLAVWGLVALALLPLVWSLGGPDRRFVTLSIALSLVYFPLITSQVDGASNALVPVAMLLTVYLARTGWRRAALVGGILSTARFPSLFPIAASTGGAGRGRWLAAGAALGSFAAGTALAYVVWGASFWDPVFLGELGRRSFSLNVYGIFLLGGGLPSGLLLPALQAVLTLALVLGVFLTIGDSLWALGITTVGIALLSQFLSFNFLIWLLPISLLGARPRWWLWTISVVGTLDYVVALAGLAFVGGPVLPAEILDAALTALLLALFLDLLRTAPTLRAPRRPTEVAEPSASTSA